MNIYTDNSHLQNRSYDNYIKNVKPQEEPCLHKQCPMCHGTGIKEDGSTCIHMISCPCPRCTPRC